MLLGIVKEVIYFLQAFRSDPHSWLKDHKGGSGGTFAYFRATFAEYMILRIVKGVIYIL